jgi:3D (Asp-Asp-Asp) domain-containing protein
MKRFAVAATLSAVAYASLATPSATAPVSVEDSSIRPPGGQALEFLLPAPADDALGRTMRLWGTWYHMPIIEAAEPGPAAATGVPLIGTDGEPISAPLSERDWCYAALQGSVWVKDADGNAAAFVFMDAGGPEQVNCDAALGKLDQGVKRATRRARFASFSHPAGCDARPIPVIPFRTIAVDRSVIPLGSVLYIPALRGQIFHKDGEVFAHDGYVFAGDVGGAIEGNHVDFFVDNVTQPPLPEVISSHPGDTFKAFVVSSNDPAVAALKEAHRWVCEELPPRPPVGGGPV